MKFFITLDVRHGKNDDPSSPVGSVYGPYENDKAVEEALARLWPNNKKGRFLVFDGQIASVKPSAKEKPEYEKRAPGNFDNYVKEGKGYKCSYKCKSCGGIILGAIVVHPVHLRDMPGAGYGECKYETVPYCPNCETEPNPNGEPIYI